MESGHRIVNYSPSSTNPTMGPQTSPDFILPELNGGGGGGNGRNSVVKSGLEQLAANLRPTKWTDEKHGLYLKSMEASFVDQLHDSIDILGWSSQKYPLAQHDASPQKHITKHNSSGQFKVFREGWRGKINFVRDEAESNNGDESRVVEITSNPWIRRYKSECRQHTRRPASLQGDLAMPDKFTASGFYVRHRASNKGNVSPSLEVTDQNFIDEDTKDESVNEVQSSKRIRTEKSANQD